MASIISRGDASMVDERRRRAALLSTCRNFASIRDVGGRQPIHWAAACGRRDLLEWLITEFDVELNAQVQKRRIRDVI